MSNISKALVALDLSSADEQLLQYSRIADDWFGLSKLYFLHVIPDFLAPENQDEDFFLKFAPEVPLDEAVRNKLEARVKNALNGIAHSKVSVEVIEGQPYQKLAHWVEVKGADLLIFGKKKKSSGSGITSRRAARQVRANLFLVPDTPPSAINRILVPMDFSDNSVRALLQAVRIKRKYPAATIEVVHLIRILKADHYYGLTQTVSYRADAISAAGKAYEKILKDQQIPETEAPIVFLDDEYGNVFRHLWEYTEQQQPDLVVMGAKGHNVMHNFLYGSVTEDFVDYCEGIPVLVVR